MFSCPLPRKRRFLLKCPPLTLRPATVVRNDRKNRYQIAHKQTTRTRNEHSFYGVCRVVQKRFRISDVLLVGERTVTVVPHRRFLFRRGKPMGELCVSNYRTYLSTTDRFDDTLHDPIQGQKKKF